MNKFTLSIFIMLCCLFSYYSGTIIGEGRQYKKDERCIELLRSLHEQDIRFGKRFYEMEAEIQRNKNG